MTNILNLIVGVALGAAVALLIVTYQGGVRGGQTNAETNTIQVTGRGQVTVTPDRAAIDFGVQTQGETAAEALQETSRRMNAALEAVRGTELEGLSVETTQISVEPVYETIQQNQRERRILAGYRAQQGARAELENPSAAGALVDAAVRSGADTVSRVQFFASDPESAEREALRLAGADALARAEAVAAGAGLRVIDVVSMDTQTPRNGGPAPLGLRAQAMAAEADSQAPPSETGTINITSLVEARVAVAPTR